MPPRRQRHDIGEQLLPGMPPPEAAQVNLNAPNAFGRAVMPEYWDLTPLDYADITPAMLELATAEKFRPSLVDVPRFSRFSGDYRPNPRSRYIRVALAPEEYTLMARSPMHLGESAVSETLAVRPDDSDFGVHKAAAERSGIHALEGKIESMARYLGSLQNDLAKLHRLQEAARRHWYARGKEGAMRMDLEWVKGNMFDTMFKAIRSQRDWNPEQEDLARRALIRNLFFERAKNRHIERWRCMFALDIEWTEHKIALFEDRISKSWKYIRDHSER